MLIYLPLLVGKESFSSYRTMFALNFVVTLAILETAVRIIQKNSYKNIFSILIICCFISFAYRNFRINFINPLGKEYSLVNNYFKSNYHLGVDTIYFLRPKESIFYTLYGINSFNDEFGVASTFKDWTPDPLMKQLIFEKTMNRKMAERVKVLQITDKKDFEEVTKNSKSNILVFDIPFILEREN